MRHERQAESHLTPESVRQFSSTFIPRSDMIPVQISTGRYVSVKKQLTPTLVDAHLAGNITLGAYALSPDSTAKWICLDADTDENWQKLRDLAWMLDLQSVPAYLETSRRGGHLWLFTSPLSGTDARRFGKQLLQDYKIPQVELYPKQDVLVTGPGSFVRLPFGRHLLTGRRYHFVNPDGHPIAPTIRDQIRLLATPLKAPRTFIDETLTRAPEANILTPTPSFQPRTKVEGNLLSERLKSSISVRDFVSQYVELDAQGRGYCPFHEDEHKSLGINSDRNFWHCFAGCGGGSIIDFYMKWREKAGEDPSFIPTITALAEMLL